MFKRGEGRRGEGYVRGIQEGIQISTPVVADRFLIKHNRFQIRIYSVLLMSFMAILTLVNLH